MSPVTALLALLLFFLNSSLAQDPPFTVTRPDPGDTLVLSSYSGSNEIYIDWTIAPGTEDQTVLITLQRGNTVESLETIEVVNGTAPNNGSYIWDGSDSVSLESGTDPWLARTACNYTVRLSVDGLVAYSQYFTIINEDDGPIPDSATCPIEQGIARPQFADADATGTVLDNEDTAGGNSAADDGSNGDGGGNISTSTLAVAIVVPIVVLLVVFGLLLWFGIRRGWFVRLANRRGGNNAHLTHENTAGFAGGPEQQGHFSPVVAEKKQEVSPEYAAAPRELHSEHRAWEAEVREVHQLEGDERDVALRDGNMRPA